MAIRSDQSQLMTISDGRSVFKLLASRSCLSIQKRGINLLPFKRSDSVDRKGGGDDAQTAAVVRGVYLGGIGAFQSLLVSSSCGTAGCVAGNVTRVGRVSPLYGRIEKFRVEYLVAWHWEKRGTHDVFGRSG